MFPSSWMSAPTPATVSSRQADVDGVAISGVEGRHACSEFEHGAGENMNESHNHGRWRSPRLV